MLALPLQPTLGSCIQMVRRLCPGLARGLRAQLKDSAGQMPKREGANPGRMRKIQQGGGPHQLLHHWSMAARLSLVHFPHPSILGSPGVEGLCFKPSGGGWVAVAQRSNVAARADR